MSAEPALTRAQLAELDRHAIEDLGLPGVCLMENAGAGAARELRAQALARGVRDDARVLICCGPGNNGGDGYVLARHLAAAGMRPVLASTARESRGDAGVMRAVCRRLGLPERVLADEGEAERFLASGEARADVVVDALLGTGSRGAPRGSAARLVSWACELRRARQGGALPFLVALDLPTGLDADEGALAEPCFRADLTITFGARKIGFDVPHAAGVLGAVVVCSLGVTLPSGPRHRP